jgi:hypothetical protein
MTKVSLGGLVIGLLSMTAMTTGAAATEPQSADAVAAKISAAKERLLAVQADAAGVDVQSVAAPDWVSSPPAKF